jgi:uncharacterized protein YbbC (DUF1343 family)
MTVRNPRKLFRSSPLPAARFFLLLGVGVGIISCCPKTPPPPEVAPRTEVPAQSRLERMKTAMVATGLDVLEREGFQRLKGRKVGLIANHSAINRRGVHLLDLVLEHPDVQLVALFSPEHGFRGAADEKVASGREETTGLPLHSLYGQTQRPTEEMLQGIDTMVFDIQDIGARFYTYIATMGMCMEEAGRREIRFLVLDRPNPIGGWWFDGPIQDEDLVGEFTSFLPMPLAHGLTVGEVAQLFNTQYGIGADLEVVGMEGWKRDMFFDETGLPWVNPSPNMRSVDEEILYTMVGLTENPGTGLSVGRGTDRPFEYLGAPWVNGEALARELNGRDLPGVWFLPAVFVPSPLAPTGETLNYPHTGQTCRGVRVVVTNRWTIQPVQAGIHLMHALLQLHPDHYKIDNARRLVGASWVIDALKKGENPESIIARWRDSEAFQRYAAAREKVLRYEFQTP